MAIKFRGKVVFSPGGIWVGEDGTRVKEILAGSVSGCYGAINDGVVGAASFGVTDLSASHKMFVTTTVLESASLLLQRVSPTAGSFSASFANFSGGNVSAGSATVHYLAVLD